LNDPTVEVAVLETARGGIVRSGLGYDWSQIAVLTNIQADHIGQDGIESVDDILRIKSLVAERVQEGGTIVLNADDPRLAALPAHPKIARLPRQIVFFSMHANSPVVLAHTATGGTAYVLNGDWIEEIRGPRCIRLLRASTIPATFGGMVDFQIANAMAAIAACRAYGMSGRQIAAGLLSFDNNGHNHGRLNVYSWRDGIVLLDYGHNTHAIESIGRTVERLKPQCATGILGLPGDRADNVIAEACRVAARVFDRIILREDLNLRGRRPGEMLRLMESAIRSESPQVELRHIPDELQALQNALDSMSTGELVVAFCDRTDELTSHLHKRGGELLSDAETVLSILRQRMRIPA
jgi:cyanophycin synthetase